MTDAELAFYFDVFLAVAPFLWACYLWASKKGDKQAAIFYMAMAAAFAN